MINNNNKYNNNNNNNTGCFQKVNYEEFNLRTYINFGLPTAFCMRYVSYQKNRLFYVEITEAVVWRCSVEKASLEILQNSKESACVRDSF